ncbi:NAD-dependent epimerase/dehydratase family protein [Croceibacterium ferulae]|uniref:NAD-dependent epimerase/dehydratase family protein n=1 Tax=Croceibacterium ferulae TaxID=1854641 RepID=UPI000EAFEE60|nr:NAD-dependent epimerase/dehydratase family protein [Croceibacterium ferulae]
MNEATPPLALTGGTGFVGSALIELAIGRGISVRALARSEQPPRAGVTWIRGDLADTAALERLVAGTQAVLHLAGVVSAPDPARFHQGNVEGTEALVHAAQAGGVSRFVFVSSLSAREPALSAYGRSKFHAEELVQVSGLDWTIVRPPAIYGPRDREMLELFKAARWGVIPMPPAGRASMIHVMDLARVLLALVPASPDVSQRLFEPDDGRAGGWSHREMAQAIGAAVGRRVRVPHLPRAALLLAARLDGMVRGTGAKLTADRVGYMTHPDWVCRPEKAPPADLWRPEIATGDGLAATAAWYRAKGWL